MNAKERILETVLRIPPGRVATYGQIARAAGLPGRARLVGQSMRGLSSGSIFPWHRVIGAGGKLSIPSPEGVSLQRALLEDEGVCFVGQRVDLAGFRWSEGLEDPLND